jgi:NAD(P)-dependent dehydrogenase (short-subunit alcohol dehydrogenase family)
VSLLGDRVVVVTGGGQGLGREYALALAEAGASVVVGSRASGTDPSRGTAHDVVGEITARGGTATAHIGDMAEWDEARRILDTAISTYGRVDALVHNAGALRDRVLINLSEEEWDSVVDVHLKSTAALLHFAGQHWRERTRAGEQLDAAVVTTTAGAGLFGNPGQTNYAAAKAGVAAVTVVAAKELSRYGVRVNSIAPVARTRLLVANPDIAERVKAPDDPTVFDFYDPANVAPVVVYLVSPGCPLTGQVLNVQGGQLCRYEGWHVTEEVDLGHSWTVDQLRDAISGWPAGVSTAAPPGRPGADPT